MKRRQSACWLVVKFGSRKRAKGKVGDVGAPRPKRLVRPRLRSPRVTQSGRDRDRNLFRSKTKSTQLTECMQRKGQSAVLFSSNNTIHASWCGHEFEAPRGRIEEMSRESSRLTHQIIEKRECNARRVATMVLQLVGTSTQSTSKAS